MKKQISNDNTTVSPDLIVATVRAWVEKAVIGLNLCPFAKAVHTKNQVRYIVSTARTPQALLDDLVNELRILADTDPAQLDTTLLIHPDVLTDFLDYNDFLDIADTAIDQLDLTGHIQIASFHPQYQFAESAPDAIDNYTNRSPYPLLHLLRENSIERAVATFPDTSSIYEKNIETLRTLGHDGWQLLGLDALKK
jgi:hypothetical protein